MATWDEVSSSEPDDDLLNRLARSYEAADALCGSEPSNAAGVPLWTNLGWRNSEEVRATEDDDLRHALEGLDLPLWIQPRPNAYRQFAGWCGLTLLDHRVDYGEPEGSLAEEPDMTRLLNVAAGLFATELAEVDPATWKAVASRCREWGEMRVIRSELLDVPATLQFQAEETRRLHVRKHALVRDGCLYLSRLATLGDRATVTELFRRVNLTQAQGWNLANALRMKFIEARDFRGSEHAPPSLVSSVDEEEDTYEFPAIEQASDTGSGEIKLHESLDGTREDLLEEEPPIAVPDVDDYQVISDDRNTGEVVEAGGEVVRLPAVPRRPGRPIGSSSEHARRLSVGPKEVERRGLQLLKRHVLDLEGILISDQTLRAGVGADLYCSDLVFRELKVFSGRASSRIHLTRHEQARAESSTERYELVIIEHVWSEPLITIIPDPLGILKWQATGGVDVVDWQSKANAFRQIRLGP